MEISDQAPPWTTALITGASSGIGEALARNLAARGVHVIVTARRLPLLKKIASEIIRAGGKATAVRLDVAKADATARTIVALDKKFGGIDLVIANAGVGIPRDLPHSWSWPAIRDATHINYAGALATITALLPSMVARGRGHVVAMSSLASYTALPDAAGYSSPKAGLSRFMECLALDLQQTGVAVTTVHVGFVATPIVAESTIPLPFLMPADKAADYMLRRILRRKREINFPKPMVFLVYLMAKLPFFAKKFLARKFSPARG
ncbi:MAG: SDR family NAD(P)-dependent oxidoreductase [Turneriella sp.]|nr:SDR family NAD(P)-dependent oxidoreductase [Turneriella sp.]